VGSAISDTMAKISGVASIGMQLLFLKYSRDDEREADALGVEYSRRGRYNPGEMVPFFSSLEKYGDLSGDRSALPGFLSTHPLTSERIRNVQLMLVPSDQKLRLNKESYLKTVDGTIYGENPRQGYTEGNAFYHPDLRFTYAFPSGWKLQNTPAQVTMASADGHAALILTAEKSSQNLNEYARIKAEGIEGRQFVEEKKSTTNGLSTLHQVYDLPQEQSPTLRIRLSFIRKGDFIYAFSAVSTGQDFSKYDSDFQRIVGSFRELTDSKFINRLPQRLRLVQASGRETLSDIFQQEGMAKEAWPKFAILNRLDLGQKPAPGQWIKTIRP
jgi:predicted Zn-dependent protease